jgi:amino acid adenylation domain-containing protein
MKSIYEFLSDLARQDIKLWVEDNRLRCNAPKDVLTPEIRSQLAERKGEILSFLQQNKLAFYSRQIAPVSRPKNLPLSFAQQRLWFIEQLEGGTAVYNIPAALHLNGTLNVTALQKALQEIARRHEVLRTRFTTVENSPVQVIYAEPQFTWLLVDLQHLPIQERTAEVQQLATQEAKTPFNLGEDSLLRVKLLRLAEKEHVLLLTMHHIIADGWSLGILVRELSVIYKAFDAQKSFSLPPLSIQYADFALWQHQYLKGEVLETHLNYWKQQLAQVPTLLELPTDYPRPELQTFRGCSHSFALERELTEKLKTLSQQSEASLFMILLAALGILLSRYSRQKDLVIGTPIANRNRQEIEPLIGFFANTLALRLNLRDNPSFRNFLGQVRQVTLDAYAHQDLPFDRLVEELQPERSLSHSPLFQVMFALQNAPLGKLNLPNLTLKPIETKSVTAKFDLTLSLRETEVGLEGIWEYNSDLFEAATITRMMDNYKTLLEAIVANPDERVVNLPLLSEAARQQVLVECHSSKAESIQLPCIHKLFETQVEKNPDAVAAVFAPNNFKLTYRQLNARTNQLAHYLQSLGVKPGVVVGVCLERSPLKIIGLLGILKAGAAYLLLEPTYPQEYQKKILTDIPVSVVLSQPGLKECLPEDETQIICLWTDKETIVQQSQENPIDKSAPESQAYVDYSNYRAVSVSHSAIALHLNWFIDRFALSESDVVLQQALTQSSAVWEIFGTLITGGCLLFPCSKAQDNPAYLQNLIVSQQVSLIHFVPSELSAFLDSLNAGATQLNSLRRVFCSGESLSSKLIEKYEKVLQCSLVRLYGYPETVGEVIYREIKNDRHSANIFPISSANGSVYVLDEQLQPVPLGVTGEIYLRSLSLAQGYLHDREATARHFIKNPFSETRLFKTNELGRILDDGFLQLIGSCDRKVWIKGFRVSLSEIETKLLENRSVEDCRVLMRETDTIAQLVAYVVTSGQLSLEQLQSHLQVLPANMFPSVYVPLSALPLTLTGQVDEEALKRLPVIDLDLVQRWEEQLRSLPEIDRVAVVVQQQTQTIPPVHLRDLLLQSPNLYREEEKPKLLTPLPEARQQSGTKKLAVVHGESLEFELDAPLTLAEALGRAAFQNSNRGIVYIRCDGSEFVQSYENLLEEAQRILTGLRKLGLKPQDKVIFQLERIQDFIPAFWGCILGGFVPVPLSIPPTYEQVNSAVSKLHNAWQMLGKPIVLAGENSVFTAVFAPLAPQDWGEQLQSPPDLGDLGGKTMVYSTENCCKIRQSNLQLDDRLKAIDEFTSQPTRHKSAFKPA